MSSSEEEEEESPEESSPGGRSIMPPPTMERHVADLMLVHMSCERAVGASYWRGVVGTRLWTSAEGAKAVPEGADVRTMPRAMESFMVVGIVVGRRMNERRWADDEEIDVRARRFRNL